MKLKLLKTLTLYKQDLQLKLIFFYRFLILGLTGIVTTQYTLKPVNNSVGLFYNEVSYLKVSNNIWTLLVYKDLKPIKEALDDNEKLLNALDNMLNYPNPKMTYFKTGIRTHLSLLIDMSKAAFIKYAEIMEDTNKYRTKEV